MSTLRKVSEMFKDAVIDLVDPTVEAWNSYEDDELTDEELESSACECIKMMTDEFDDLFEAIDYCEDVYGEAVIQNISDRLW